jgi:pimeloyl-ACP methyl ester carboxylesterase
MAVFEKSRWLTCAGIQTFVAEAGSGPPLVFLHGNPDTHDVWSGVVARLQNDFTCYAPDLPGYGRSEPQYDCRLEAQAEWVADLLTGLGGERPHLVIHDVGGTYGMAFAAKHRDRIGKLTLFNAAFFPDFVWHFWGKVWRTPVLGELSMLLGNRALFVRETMKGSPRLPREYAERTYEFYGAKTRRQVLRWYRYMDPERFAGWDQEMLAAFATFPAQVIWGDRDPYIPKATADRFGVQVHRFPELGHWAMVEAPNEVAALIRALRG